MLFKFSVLVFDVGQPARQFLRWHCKNLVGKFVQTIRERVNTEEVCRLPSVD